MFCKAIVSVTIGLILCSSPAWPQETVTKLAIAQILQKADSVSNYQDSLRQHTNYKAKETFVFNELDENNSVKNADTAIAIVTMEGDKEISREIIYSTKQPNGEKKNDEGKKEISFSYANPDYNFSLTGIDEANYIISVSPKGSPKKGDIEGTVKVDGQSFETRVMEFKTLEPDGALKEFATSMSFEPMEGGLLVLRQMRMKGYAKAFLGIFKMRFSGEVKYSEYQLIK
jgi:hypothetical protein